MAMKDLVNGGAACVVPGSSSSSNPLEALTNTLVGSSSKTQLDSWISGSNILPELVVHVPNDTTFKKRSSNCGRYQQVLCKQLEELLKSGDGHGHCEGVSSPEDNSRTEVAYVTKDAASFTINSFVDDTCYTKAKGVKEICQLIELML